MEKLPIGIQSIEKIIHENYLYIDKTEIIYKLITSGQYFFLSRPRRFGKSLLISTLEQIFKGDKNLFKGLYIYDKIDWKEYPVIRLDFSQISAAEGHDKFKNSLGNLINRIGTSYNIELKSEVITDKVSELIMKLGERGKVVILVDEYDKPIVDYITDFKRAEGNREVLRQLYAPLKGLDKYIKFVFLTGVSKFSKVSIFSGLNNLRDITLADEFSDICGITQVELEKYFSEYIEDAINIIGEERQELLNEIKKFYNGYSWDTKTHLYNPFSLLNFFADKQFRNYWFDSGTPAFLVDLFRQNWFDVTQLESVNLDSSVLDSYDIDKLKIVPLLFQTGYLTIKKIKRDKYGLIYHLGYPNNEVRQAMIKNLILEYAQIAPENLSNYGVALRQALNEADILAFTNQIKSIFAGVPSILQANQKESYFHSMFYFVLKTISPDVELEVLTDKGRIDGVIEFNNKIYIIEFKLGKPEEAVKQIKEKKYYEKYLNQNKEIYLLGVGGFENKNIKCLIEKVN